MQIIKSRSKENAPLLFNLAELQNECTKKFKIKPDETLEIAQNLYEKKLITYPRTDARVLSKAVAKIIKNNLNGIAKGYKDEEVLNVLNYDIKEAQTNPPTRYNSGSIILAMENAGKLIEEEDLREQIKEAGIGTSATRAEIMKKLEKIKYIAINSKTQIITPTQKGEAIFDIVNNSMPDTLNPKLTASWEKGLDMVAKKEIKSDEFMGKLEKYIRTKFSRLIL